jgi:hypothetical protein
MHGVIIDQGGGYWVKLEAWQVSPSEGVPHGLRYSLTLHEPSGARILGFDNAHAVRAGGYKFSGQRHPYDHKHRHACDKGLPYEFLSAAQLLADFFCDVDRVLTEVQG